MKRFTPLLTLLTGITMAAVLYAMSAAATPVTPPPAEPGPGAAAAAAAPPEADPAESDYAADDAGAEDEAAEEDATEPAGKDAAEGPDATWAGRVDGGAATIAITAKDGVAIAYLCDGAKVESWLQGTAEGGDLTLKSKDGAKLTGSFGNGKASGEVVVGKQRFTFRAAAVEEPSGLYRSTAEVRGARVVGGWIILADGTQVGIVTVDGKPTPAPPLDPATDSTVVNGTRIVASTPTSLNGR